MPYVNNQGIHIHYQVTGQGPALVLQHAFSMSLQDWHEFGYVDKLQEEYRLILVDARGHGASDKLHEPEAYTLEKLVSDINAVLDHLKIEKAHYLGYSMGGWIGFGMAKYASNRLDSLIIGGAQPFGWSFEGARQALSHGIDTWMENVVGWGIYSPEGLSRERLNDAAALHALIQDRPDMSDILPDLKMPCLIYAGDADNQYKLIRRCAEELPNASFVSLPDLIHSGVMPRSDLVVPYIKEFTVSF